MCSSTTESLRAPPPPPPPPPNPSEIPSLNAFATQASSGSLEITVKAVAEIAVSSSQKSAVQLGWFALGNLSATITILAWSDYGTKSIARFVGDFMQIRTAGSEAEAPQDGRCAYAIHALMLWSSQGNRKQVADAARCQTCPHAFCVHFPDQDDRQEAGGAT